MKPKLFFTAVIASLTALTAQAQDSKIEKVRSSLQEWVETRQIISKEKADWTLLKQTLVETKALMETQNTELDAKLEELQESKSAADDKREELLAENAELKASTEALLAAIVEIESKLFDLIPQLPEALTDKIDPLIRRIPEPGKPTKASLGERVQNVVGILSQVDSFNNKFTVVNRTQELADGREVQVSTMYVGLGQAYFVDTTGSYAGKGYPTEEGWVFEENNAIAPEVSALLAAHSGEATEINFVPVPVDIR